jgi:hypothetical protein
MLTDELIQKAMENVTINDQENNQSPLQQFITNKNKHQLTVSTGEEFPAVRFSLMNQ